MEDDMDIVYVVITVLFFAVSFSLVLLCDRLYGGKGGKA
jgi:hypothetical protein